MSSLWNYQLQEPKWPSTVSYSPTCRLKCIEPLNSLLLVLLDQIGAVESVKGKASTFQLWNLKYQCLEAYFRISGFIPIAASDIYAPISGTIEEINEELGDQPALLNRSPEENGKLFPPYLLSSTFFRY